MYTRPGRGLTGSATGRDQVIADIRGRMISRLRTGACKKLLPSSRHLHLDHLGTRSINKAGGNGAFPHEGILNWLRSLNYFPNDKESKETLSEQMVRSFLGQF